LLTWAAKVREEEEEEEEEEKLILYGFSRSIGGGVWLGKREVFFWWCD